MLSYIYTYSGSLQRSIFWNYFLGDFNYHQCIKINNRISGQMAWLVVLFQKSRFENTPYLSSMGILRVKMKLSVYSASHSQSKFHLHWHWGQKHSFKGGKSCLLPLGGHNDRTTGARRQNHSRHRLQDTLSSGFLVFITSQELVSIYKAKYRAAKSSKVCHGLPSGLSLICWFLLTLKKENKQTKKNLKKTTCKKSHIRRLALLLFVFFNIWLCICCHFHHHILPIK